MKTFLGWMKLLTWALRLPNCPSGYVSLCQCALFHFGKWRGNDPIFALCSFSSCFLISFPHLSFSVSLSFFVDLLRVVLNDPPSFYLFLLGLLLLQCRGSFRINLSPRFVDLEPSVFEFQGKKKGFDFRHSESLWVFVSVIAIGF